MSDWRKNKNCNNYRQMFRKVKYIFVIIWGFLRIGLQKQIFGRKRFNRFFWSFIHVTVHWNHISSTSAPKVHVMVHHKHTNLLLHLLQYFGKLKHVRAIWSVQTSMLKYFTKSLWMKILLLFHWTVCNYRSWNDISTFCFFLVILLVELINLHIFVPRFMQIRLNYKWIVHYCSWV